jgi:hypothetical protein
MASRRDVSGGICETFFLRKGDTSKRGENSAWVEELYCGNSTNAPQPCKEAENAPGNTSTCVVKTRLSDLLVSPAHHSVSHRPGSVPLFHLEQNPNLRPCRLTSPASDAIYLSLPGGLSNPIWTAFKQKILPTTDPQDSKRGVRTMSIPLGQAQWANLQYHNPHIPHGQNSNTLGGKAHMQGQHDWNNGQGLYARQASDMYNKQHGGRTNQYNGQMRTTDLGYGYNNQQYYSGNTYGDISARHIRPVELPLPLSTTDPPTSLATYAHFNGMHSFVGKDTHNAQFNDNDNLYSYDTNGDRFPPPPPRGRKRRQTTLWSSQTGETNTSASGSLVCLPDENSALKAPEHE